MHKSKISPNFASAKQKNTQTMKTITMRNIFAALVKEMGEAEGRSIFEWYCKSYKVDATDIAPSRVVYEVFGI